MKRLYKSRIDRKLAGVLGGIAAYLNIDSTIVRLLFVILLFFTVGTSTFIYIAAALIMPDEWEVR